MPEPSWREVKAALKASIVRALLKLLQDLHDVSRDNQAALNVRLGLGGLAGSLSLDCAGHGDGAGHFSV